MATIKAPYNFVPINKDVVSPHWFAQISHDIPFKDGLSGTIVVTLKAETPIFVRDGIGQKQAKANYKNDIQQSPHSFSKYNNRYFIPGTSIKGMIRNVLEILSFGRMEGRVNDHKYSLRDLSGAMKDQYLKDFTPDKIYCGWLKKENDNSYSILDCGLPGRITHSEIDRACHTTISSYFSDREKFNPKSDYEKSAQKKYELFGEKNKNERFSFDRADAGRQIYKIDSNGNLEGRLVFTGQPGLRQQKNGKWSGHHLEFIFFKGKEVKRIVPEKVMKDFFFAYFEQDKTKWSEDWKVWRKRLKDGEEIPVFFHKDDKDIKSLGLSYLYKLPYRNSVLDTIKNNQGTCKPDLSEAIFGHVEKNNALKGRVHFGHAFATPAVEVDKEKKEVLSSPKASYYPTYIRQKVEKSGRVADYKTFMDAGAEISGWKRYPVHESGVKHNPPPQMTSSEKIITRFIPLKAGAEFTFSIRYHNLRPVELGALLSALTFHGTEDTFHSIGMAKPLGYGKVRLMIKNNDSLDIPKYLSAFEAYMNVKLQNKAPEWHLLEQVTELITMAKQHKNSVLEYMCLDDHVLVKNDTDKNKTPKPREALNKYSDLISSKVQVNCYSNTNDIAIMAAAIHEELKNYLHKDNVDEVVQVNRNATKDELESLWLEKKAQLLLQLNAQKAAIAQSESDAKLAKEKEERAKKKDEESQRVKDEGLGLDKIDIKNRRSAMDNLTKAVEKFGRSYYKQSDIKKVIQQNPAGYLPIEYHKQLIECLQKIFTILSENEQNKWNEPFPKNAIRKKIKEWIGEENAREIKFNIND